MTKTPYSAEDIKQVFQVLLLEKKKAKELEQQLQAIKSAQAQRPVVTIEEITHLKRLLIAFKKRYDSEKAEQQENEASIKKTVEVLARENRELKGKLLQAGEGGGQKEAAALQKSFDESQRIIQRQKLTLEKLNSLIQEKDKRIFDLQQFEYSSKKGSEHRNELEAALDKEKGYSKQVEKEKDDLNAALGEQQSHAEQLERVIQFLRERSEEAHLEANQLKEEFQASQDTISSLRKEIDVLQEKLHNVHNNLGKEQEDKTGAQDELQAIQSQFEYLRKKAHDYHNEAESHARALNEANGRIQALEKEKARLEIVLAQKHKGFEELEKDVSLIKQSLVKGLREAKDIESRYLETVNEKVAILAKLNQLQQHIDKQRDEIASLKNQLAHSSSREQALKKSFDDQILAQEGARKIELQTVEKRHTQEIKDLQDKLHKLERQLEEALRAETDKLQLENRLQNIKAQHNDASRQISLLEEDKRKLQESLRSAQNLGDEKDSQLHEAQQHLAKKVRENSTLNDRLEEYKSQLDDFQNTYTQLKTKNAELETRLEIQIQQEKRLQDHLQETLKNSEAQLQKWEEKYFQTYEKFQAHEARIRELEKVEEKHHQLQALFSNLGSVLGTSGSFPIASLPRPPVQAREVPPQASLPPKEVPAPPVFGQAEPQPSEAEKAQGSRPYQNLFDMPRPASKPKQNLFE